jgi:hypothetical protein
VDSSDCELLLVKYVLISLISKVAQAYYGKCLVKNGKYKKKDHAYPIIENNHLKMFMKVLR